MRRYEVVVVFVPSLSEEEVQTSAETFAKVLQDKGAQIINVDYWGKRRLAYPIKKYGEGSYVIITLEEDPAEAVAELERKFKVSDQVIRFLTIRVDLDMKRADKTKSKREARAQRRQTTPSSDSKQPEVVAVKD